jgi:hypothetical protein
LKRVSKWPDKIAPGKKQDTAKQCCTKNERQTKNWPSNTTTCQKRT